MEKLPVSIVGMRHAFGGRELSNEEVETTYGLPSGWVEDKTGIKKRHAWENGPDAPVSASLDCLDRLLLESGIDRAKITAIFGTTNPITIEGKTDEVSLTKKFAQRANLPNLVKVSDEGFGCGGPAVGVDSLCKWLREQPSGTYAVYVTQDWPTKMVRTRNVAALFSDAVSVSIWTNGSDGIAEITHVFSAESTIADEALGIVGGFWEMDGRQVSEAAKAVPGLVAERLQINLNDYEIVPHQPNPKLLETMERVYDVEMHKSVAIEHGNPTCSGAFIALEKVLIDKGISSADTEKDILVIPFGAGGVGGFILRRKKN